MPEETEVRSPDPMAVSLDLELLTLANATRGAEILADYLTRQGFLDDPSEKDAPVSVFSILSLVGGRLDQLRRVVRGEEDPAHIWAAHNASTFTDSLADVDGNIVLFAWKARGMPLVVARPSAWGLTPEEREARRALDLDVSQGKLSKARKTSGKIKMKASAPKSPNSQQERPKDAAKGENLPPEAPSSTVKNLKGSPPGAH